MFAATKEDLLQAAGKVVFGDKASKAQALASGSLPSAFDKYLSVLEGLVPENGFVNGLDFPTVADVALVSFAESKHPFQAAMEAAGYEWQSKYPKIRAIVDRTKEVASVKAYLTSSASAHQAFGPALFARIAGKAIGHALTFNSLRRHGVGCGRREYMGNETPPSCSMRPGTSTIEDPLELIYFPIAGRGELVRLIAAAGGLEMANSFPGDDWKNKVGLFGSLPILKHGSMQVAQSGAIESYISTIAPKFKDLTVQQRAYDDCIAGIKEDLLVSCAKYIFGDDSKKAMASTELPPVLDKFLGALENLTPQDGFIQGLDYPTTSDLVLLNFAEAAMPFGKAMEMAGGYDWQAKFPKIQANVARTKEAPGVKEYLTESTFMKGSF
jgi:glutathione S-transferase